MPRPDPADDLFKELVVSDPGRVRKTGVVLVGLRHRPHRRDPPAWCSSRSSGRTAAPEHPGLHSRPHLQPAAAAAAAAAQGLGPDREAGARQARHARPEPETPKFTAEIPKEEPLQPRGRATRTRSRRAARPAPTSAWRRAWRAASRAAWWAACPGGVLGGVIGGTGDGVVMDYDQAPRPIKITQPKYPPEAFVKKIEGTVEVEILIDSTGRVAKARVVRSIPAAGPAALQTVYQWVFSPAIKNGRPWRRWRARPSRSGSSRPPLRLANCGRSYKPTWPRASV